MELGKLEKIDLRKVWKHEATDFTTWLAQEENLSLLSDEIGIDICLIQTEASVGKFNVDILAQEENTGRKIVIENQLELTDHDHLGKIITYASGYDAEIIVWIVRNVRAEHKQAVDWLNEHTDDKINFFAIKMEVWQIGASPYAPKFHIISQPNDWAKAVKKTTSQTALSTTKSLQLEFWTKFKEFVQDNDGPLRLRKPAPQHWYDVGSGFPGVNICLTVNSQTKQIGCEIYILNSKELFHALESQKEEIQKELNHGLQWLELPKKKASRIRHFSDGDVTNTDKWEEYFSWLMKETISFKNVFKKYMTQFKE
jgi:hypothetical protein